MYKLKAESWLALAGFSALSLLLRFTAFSRSVIDWDESLFLLMGRAILRGEIPYTTVWEHSPVGGPLLFAAAQWLFGESVLAIRILTWLAASLTCWLLYLMANDLAGQGRVAGVVAGLSYAVYSLNNSGQAAHRELFFAPLVTLAVWLLVGQRFQAAGGLWWRTTGRLLAAGFLLGAGLQLKYLYIWDWAGVAVIALLPPLDNSQNAGRIGVAEAARRIALLAAGPVALVGAVAFYFALNRHLDEFVFANFITGASYAVQQPLDLDLLVRKLRYQVTSNMLPWLGLLLMPVYLMGARNLSPSERRRFLYVGIWFFFALVGALFTRQLFGHYFLQVLPALCVLLGLVVAGALTGARIPPATSQRGVLVALILLGPLVPRAYPELMGSVQAIHQRLVVGQPPVLDLPAQVAHYLRQCMKTEDVLFVVDYEPIVYYLADADAATRYLFTSHLTDVSYSWSDGIDQPAEIDAAFGSQPVYVVRQSPKSRAFTNAEAADRVDVHLEYDYVLETTMFGNDVLTQHLIVVEIYRLQTRQACKPAEAFGRGRFAGNLLIAEFVCYS